MELLIALAEQGIAGRSPNQQSKLTLTGIYTFVKKELLMQLIVQCRDLLTKFRRWEA